MPFAAAEPLSQGIRPPRPQSAPCPAQTHAAAPHCHGRILLKVKKRVLSDRYPGNTPPIPRRPASAPAQAESVVQHSRSAEEHSESVVQHSRSAEEHSESVVQHSRSAGEHSESVVQHSRSAEEHSRPVKARSASVQASSASAKASSAPSRKPMETVRANAAPPPKPRLEKPPRHVRVGWNPPRSLDDPPPRLDLRRLFRFSQIIHQKPLPFVNGLVLPHLNPVIPH
jgi:hypothetical protein